MAIDWTKPLETNEENPRRLVIDGYDSWDNTRWVRLEGSHDPNNEGQWFNDDGSFMEMSSNGAGFLSMGIRNVAAADSEATDELAQLRAWKADAIARFPELDEPESEEDAAERIENEYWNDRLRRPADVALAAIAWARANPR